MAKRILLVDDDADFRETTQMILVSAGYEVSQAASRLEAERKLQAEKIDLIILDVMMETDTEGFHLAYQVRQDPRLAKIPILMLTCIEEKTGESLDPEESGDFLPVDCFLRKPLEAKELTSAVAELLR